MPPATSAHHHHHNSAASSAANSTSASLHQGSGSAKPKNKMPMSGSAAAGASNGGGSSAGSSGSAGASIEGINFLDLPTPVLHRYRHAYRLSTPSASKPYSSIVLSTGIGKKSPSRVGPGARVSHEMLAREVRKNFNAQPVIENEVIVNFFYSVGVQGKHFRMQFPPGKKGCGGATVPTAANGTTSGATVDG